MGQEPAEAEPPRASSQQLCQVCARLQALQDQGRLLLAGPHPAADCENPGAAGFTGSLIVAEFPALEDAERWAAEDPYVSAGVYARVTVKPFKRVFPQ